MQNPENGAARLLKLLTSINLEDEYLDGISTYGLAAELATLIKRAGITEEMLSSWERERQEQIIDWQPAAYSSQPQPPEGMTYAMVIVAPGDVARCILAGQSLEPQSLGKVSWEDPEMPGFRYRVEFLFTSKENAQTMGFWRPVTISQAAQNPEIAALQNLGTAILAKQINGAALLLQQKMITPIPELGLIIDNSTTLMKIFEAQRLTLDQAQQPEGEA